MRVLFIIFIILGCRKSQPETASNMTKSIKTQIMLLEIPFGSDPDLRAKEGAAQWLLSNAAESYPILLERLKSNTASPAIIELLPRFNRKESIPFLEKLLKEHDQIAFIAGQALAQHHGQESREALRRTVREGESDAMIAAIEGLLTMNNTTDCSEFLIAAKNADEIVRYHAIRAAWHLKCLTDLQLKEIRNNDSSESVRILATELISRKYK